MNTLAANKFQTGMWAPVRTQHAQVELQIEGFLPLELQGAYYRIGPNPVILNEPGYHQFDGDGMLHCILIDKGKAFYSNRWIATEKYDLESHFKKKIFYYFKEYIEKHADEISPKGRQTGPANTSLLFFNNRLFALHESSVPIEVDPITLETIGKWDFLGNDSWSGMTAHPKICPITQQLNTFVYEPIKKILVYYCLDEFGKLINNFQIKLPYIPLLVHDFTITPDYVIFMFFPLIIETSTKEGKLNEISWEPTQQTRLVVYDKRNGILICEYTLNAFYSYHFINAYQADNAIIIDLFLYEAELTSDEFWEPLDKPSYPYRVELDLTNNQIHCERLATLSGEFSSIDQQLSGLEYQEFLMCATIGNQRKKYEYDSIVSFNLVNKIHQFYDFGEYSCCTEPCLVKLENHSQAFVFTLVYSKESDSSHLAIFEANNLEKGPICRLLINARVPFGFHGLWLPGKPHSFNAGT